MVIQISRLQLHDQVALRLRTMLVEGRIAPGAKLNERELSEELKVSRTPLREAIKLLAAEGLVDLLPNRGAVAVKLGEADVIDAFEVLAGLEGLSGELAVQRASEAQVAEIRARQFEMLACHARSDLSGYYRQNAMIHDAINAAAGNPLLARTYSTINARAEKWKSAVKEHGRMIDALDARDAPALRAVMVEHLLKKRDTVLQLMRATA